MSAEITGITKTPLSSNKIDNSKATSSNTMGSNSQNSENTQKTVNPGTSGPTDKTTFTQQAKELRIIEKALDPQTDINDNRVENLKLEIDAGRYNVDAQRVAEKLIAFEKMFIE